MNSASPDTRFWPTTRSLLCLLALCPVVAHGAATKELPSAADLLARMIERAKAVASADDASRYTCQCQTVSEQLTSDGKVAATEERTYKVELVAGYPLRQLTKIAGKDLTPAALAEEQDKERQLRRKFTSLSMEDLAARKETWLTTNLLARYEFMVEDRVSFSNRATIVLTFRPKAGSLPVENLQDRLLNVMAGKIWVDEQDADAVQASIGLVDTLSLGWFGLLGSLSKCDLNLERTHLPNGAWANAKQSLQIQVRKLFSTQRFRITEVSSDYQRVPAKSAPPAGNVKAK